jgi:hypothetical protein
MNHEGEVTAYIARKPCGCVVGATVNDGEHQREMFATLAGWTRAGLSIELVGIEAARTLVHRCIHIPPRVPKRSQRVATEQTVMDLGVTP